MAKKAYIGVDGITRKVKKIYLGVPTKVDIYDEQSVTKSITTENISKYFKVTNGSYYFAGVDGVFTSNNGGKKSTTANTRLVALVDMDVSFDYSYASEANYDLFTLYVAGTAIEDEVSGTATSKSWSGHLTKGQAIDFTYTKDNSNDKNGDKCTFSNMVVTSIESELVETVVKDVARRVVRGYVGVGGVARPFWTTELTYYGEVTPLGAVRYSLIGASNKEYAFFAGGAGGGNTALATVYTYDKNLTRGTATELTKRATDMGSASVGEYAMFAGGQLGRSTSHRSVDAYDGYLVKTSAPELDRASSRISGTGNGKYAIFAGGSYVTESVSTPANAYVYAYDENLTRTLLTNLEQARCDIAATSIGEITIFAGGVTGGSSGGRTYADVVDCYDGELTKIAISKLSEAVEDRGAASVGSYALIAGGYTYNDGTNEYRDTVEVYDSDLTKTIGTPLSVRRSWASGFTLGEYAAFAGGYNHDIGYFSTVDAYDKNLTRTIPTGLKTADVGLAVAVVGNFALLASGYEERKTVEAYTI